MPIHEFVWPQDRVDHIAGPGVTPEEVEQACFGRPLVQRAVPQGENPVYYSARPIRVDTCSPSSSSSGRQRISGDRKADDGQREAPIPAVEGTMKARRLPQTDSIQELARSWDTHDLTEFEDQLEEVTQPVFERRTVIPLKLESAEAEAVRKMAKSKGVADAELIRGWVREKIHAN